LKILALSDRVVDSIYSLQIKERFGDIDLVLSCGDLPFYYLEFVATMLNVPIYYVLGNHDRGPEYTASGQVKAAPRGCINLDGRVIEDRGLLIAGLEGSMRYNNWGPHQYTEWEMRAKIWRLWPRLLLNRVFKGRCLDILITHAPPYRIHDGPDLCHTGFRSFLEFMDRCKPRYLIHGHFHIRYSFKEPLVTTYNVTQVVNACGYRVLSIELLHNSRGI